MEWMASPDAWIALAALTALELVLGIDNIVFISILSGKLPEHQQARARTIGLLLAMGMRIALLFSIAWIVQLTEPWFSLLGQDFSGRSLILIMGGLFLLAKATFEIHDKLEGEEGHGDARAGATFMGVIVQILLLDAVFSLDSVITAVGMTDHLPVMIIAVMAAVSVMLFTAGPISTFVEGHPTVKILALSFLLLIGMTLVADGLGQHIPKGYIYFAMGFSVFVETINLRIRARREPVKLRKPYADAGDAEA
ncbi:MAG: TerC family protein [Trueperaceae bacterium]|nr:TerC family protein [Trueperaceae bacterium]